MLTIFLATLIAVLFGAFYFLDRLIRYEYQFHHAAWGARWSSGRFLFPPSGDQLDAQQLCFSALRIRLVVSHSTVDA
jgi:hypothetical protein